MVIIENVLEWVPFVIKNVLDWVCLLSKCVGMGVFVTEDVFLPMRRSLFYF